MATTKHEGTLAAAEQLGSMSLCQSVGRKVEPATKNGTKMQKTPTTKFCSACGEKSDTLKQCGGCKCVWYCDRKCQNKHRKEHKKECRLIKKILDNRGGKLDLCIDKIECKHFKTELEKRGGKLDLGPLEKPPPREECPICMQGLPIHDSLHAYFACCGKSICGGCSHQHLMKNGGRATCAFCRTALPETDAEILARVDKRVERKDALGLCMMGMHHGLGQLGLPVDQAKCIDLLSQSAALGCPLANYHLGTSYKIGRMGLQQDHVKAQMHWEKAAESGYLIARHHLGCAEAINGDFVAAMRHWRLSASGGHRGSMDNLIECFENGDLHHSDLAETLQAMYLAKAELNSEGRDEYIKHLKKTGEYDKDYYEY